MLHRTTASALFLILAFTLPAGAVVQNQDSSSDPKSLVSTPSFDLTLAHASEQGRLVLLGFYTDG